MKYSKMLKEAGKAIQNINCDSYENQAKAVLDVVTPHIRRVTLLRAAVMLDDEDPYYGDMLRDMVEEIE